MGIVVVKVEFYDIHYHSIFRAETTNQAKEIVNNAISPALELLSSDENDKPITSFFDRKIKISNHDTNEVVFTRFSGRLARPSDIHLNGESIFLPYDVAFAQPRSCKHRGSLVGIKLSPGDVVRYSAIWA